MDRAEFLTLIDVANQRGLERVRGHQEGAKTVRRVVTEAARLRKRFQLLKEKLYEMGRREGLIGGDR